MSFAMESTHLATVAAPTGRTRTAEVPAPTAAPFVSIVIPTYHEAENVAELVHRIAGAIEYAYPAYEILLVDDNSRDGIDAVVAELQAARFPVRLIVRTDQRGLSTAVIRGFVEAHGEVLVCMDADLSHPPEKLPELIAAAVEPGGEFAIGSRYVAGGGTDSQWSLFRRLNSRVATVMARPFSAARDPLAGFFAVPRGVFERCAELDPVGYKIGLEILVKARCRQVREIPIQFADRQYGESKLTFAEQLRYLRHLRRLADFKFGVVTQLVSFCLVGATGATVDLLTYATLLWATLPMTVARATAIAIALTWNYLLDRHVTFAAVDQPSFCGGYSRFAGVCTLGALVNWSVAVTCTLWIPFFQLHLLWAAVLGIASGTLVNFGLARRWAFRRGGT